MRNMPKHCEHHKPLDLGYIQWHNTASARINQKYTQVRCPNCQLLFFPDELNEPENHKSLAIIEKHRIYLEQHPKAKDVLKKLYP